MEMIRKRLARVLALMDGRALTAADHVRATRLMLELQDAGLELVDRPEALLAYLQESPWLERARLRLAADEVTELLRGEAA